MDEDTLHCHSRLNCHKGEDEMGEDEPKLDTAHRIDLEQDTSTATMK